MNGKMLWFNEAKHFGFIEAETGERIRVHRSDFLDGHAPVGRCKGLAVQFTLAGDEGGYLAIAVSRVPETDQRRATRHHNAGRLR